MAIAEYKVDTGTTISTTEYSLVNDSTTLATDTTDGVFQCVIDFNALAATGADIYRVRVYEKVYGAGTQRKVWEAFVTKPDVLVIPSLILMHGWDISVTKISGTDRSISWSIRQLS